MPEKDRYKINVIPCNTNTMSRKAPGKARSVDDIAHEREKEHDVEPKVVSHINNMDLNSGFMEKLTKRHLEMIANRTKIIERRMTKTASILF